MPGSEHSATLEDERASLRRLAALVATGADAADVFAAIAAEVAHMLHPRLVQIYRWEHDRTVTVAGTWGDGPNPFPAGSNWRWDDPTLVAMIEHLRTGRPIRIDDVAESLAGAPVDAGASVGVGSAAGAAILVDGEPWGHIGLAMAKGVPLPDRVEERLAEITELVATAINSSTNRERLTRLADEQAALRRVATLVARNAPPADVFQAVAEELGMLLAVASSGLVRFEDAETATVVAGWGRLGEVVPVGARLALGGRNAVSEIARTGKPARIDDFAHAASGPIAERANELQTNTSIGGPVVVAGRLWGAMIAATIGGEALPPETEPRLEQFTELVGTAIANAEARAELQRLADEQAARRRVATLVAEAAAPAEVFDAVVTEVAQLLGASQVGLMRAESADEITIVAHRGQDPSLVHAGMRLPLDGDSVTAHVLRSGRSARLERYGEQGGTIAGIAHRSNVSVTVGAPITVEGRVWGVLTASWEVQEPTPADAEERLTQFADLLDTAIASAHSRDQLTASRARVLTAGDEARRRVVRDIHDGAQQRLVQTILTLKLAQGALGEDGDRAAGLLAEALEQVERSNAELRELAHGILPSVLTHGGLPAAIKAVVARLELPVTVEVTATRLPPEIEASAYFIAAEALTNVVKHAQATSAAVTATADAGTLAIEVRDDGIGGADPRGHGLLGIGDRVAALGGRLRIDSPRGAGTIVAAELPVAAQKERPSA